MINDQRVLNDIIKTAQLGICGVNTVMPSAKQPALRQALKCQRKEYADIERQAKLLAGSMNFRIDQLPRLSRTMSSAASRVRMFTREPDAKIAAMMIQGNTRGMLLSLKNMRRCDQPDPKVAELAQKMLETEKNNIVSLEGFV